MIYCIIERAPQFPIVTLLCLWQLTETSFPSMGRGVLWLMPMVLGKESEGTLTLTMTKPGQLGSKVFCFMIVTLFFSIQFNLLQIILLLFLFDLYSHIGIDSQSYLLWKLPWKKKKMQPFFFLNSFQDSTFTLSQRMSLVMLWD